MREQLKRDARREELIRTEEAARTEQEFKEIGKWWDRIDANRERKERYHEQKVSNDMFDWDIFSRQIHQSKDFSDEIYMCICEMHNLVENPDISGLIAKASEKQKAVFFPRVIVGCSTAQIAECHGMTDRNVRKLIELMLDKIRYELYGILKEREKSGEFLVYEKRRFLALYKEKYEQKKKDEAADETVSEQK